MPCSRHRLACLWSWRRPDGAALAHHRGRSCPDALSTPQLAGARRLRAGGRWQRMAPTHLSTTRDITEDTDSGIVCTIRYKRGDSSMFVQSALLHEIAHALRRIAYWRSRRRAPSVAPTPGAWVDIVYPWTHDVSATGALVSALEAAGLCQGSKQCSEGLWSNSLLLFWP